MEGADCLLSYGVAATRLPPHPIKNIDYSTAMTHLEAAREVLLVLRTCAPDFVALLIWRIDSRETQCCRVLCQSVHLPWETKDQPQCLAF